MGVQFEAQNNILNKKLPDPMYKIKRTLQRSFITQDQMALRVHFCIYHSAQNRNHGSTIFSLQIGEVYS